MAVGAWKLVRFKSDPRGHLLAQVAIASVPLVRGGVPGRYLYYAKPL